MKPSSKFAIIMAIVFIILPCISYALMNNQISLTKKELSPIVENLTKEHVIECRNEDGSICSKSSLLDCIKVLKINGVRTSKRMLSVSPSGPIRGKENKICLNLEASSMKIRKDTLILNIDDPSRIYQGYIRLRGLQTYILNGDTIRFK